MNIQNLKKRTALLIVDMQVGVVANAHCRNEVITNVTELIAKARNEKRPVIWIQHSDDNLIKDSEDWHLVKELRALDSEVLINKCYGDSFEATELDSILKKLEINRVVVAGAQTDACIRATIHGAFVRGYDTILVSDAHTTEDLTSFGLPTPEKIIEFTNIYWTWQTAPGRISEVVSASDVQF